METKIYDLLSENESTKIFLIAGEPSGDILGGRLMDALKKYSTLPIEFCGVGGTCMSSAGLNSLFPMSELSVMGIAEIFPHATRLIKRISQTVEAIVDTKPDIVITIDAPGFCFRVLKRIQSLPLIKVHYVAPTVWAWRPWRAQKIAALTDHLLALLPFEPPLFEFHGLTTTFVGHPVTEINKDVQIGRTFRLRWGIKQDTPLICILPGSRLSEIKYLLRHFEEAVSLLAIRFTSIKVVIPTLPHLSEILRLRTADWPVSVIIIQEEDKFGAMAASNAGLAASGTVALELAVFGVPNVIAYRVHPLTALIVKLLVQIKYANIVNVLLGREAIPEFIQNKCTGPQLFLAIEKLLIDKAVATEQQLAMRAAIDQLTNSGILPSEIAAKAILKQASV